MTGLYRRGTAASGQLWHLVKVKHDTFRKSQHWAGLYYLKALYFVENVIFGGNLDQVHLLP